MKNKLTLIKRSTPMCPDCNKMQIILEGEGIPFNTIDIAKDIDAIEKYNLSSVPVILIDSDEGQLKLNGIQPIEVIKELLEE
ncbi:MULTISPECIES: glutaredoxin domain-containing protein [Lysinibacillus]|uniref:glutaredoxin family protein n=1 Tax=Lysinibacillus TaxID=400634 RepID=UPI00214CDD7D|nr:MULTISPECIES: glutaredoxin domain-containing protein [Lysinibacillus]UUV25991.1 thioredoxin family protein [Lysinibacillus sp. FN11]UYB48864.1 thioredoxin family protein [Lysinibacillus capsici]